MLTTDLDVIVCAGVDRQEHCAVKQQIHHDPLPGLTQEQHKLRPWLLFQSFYVRVGTEREESGNITFAVLELPWRPKAAVSTEPIA